MVHHPWLVALDVIWHIYSHLYCSSRDGGRDLLSSGKAAPTMGKVPCDFGADQPTFIFQPVAPGMIWHIYSHLYCSSRDVGRDLPSQGEAAPTMGQVPLEFWADWPTFIWHIYSGQHCFKGTLCMNLLSSRDDALMMGQVPCEFQGDQETFIFQPAAPDVILHIYSGQHCFKGVLGMDLLSSGDDALMMGQVPCEFWADWPTFIFQPEAPDMIRHIYCGQVWRYGPAIFRGCCTHQGTCRGPSLDQGAPPLKMVSGWHLPPLSSTARSKCAKSCQEQLAEKWSLTDLLKTHRGPAPW